MVWRHRTDLEVRILGISLASLAELGTLGWPRDERYIMPNVCHHTRAQRRARTARGSGAWHRLGALDQLDSCSLLRRADRSGSGVIGSCVGFSPGGLQESVSPSLIGQFGERFRAHFPARAVGYNANGRSEVKHFCNTTWANACESETSRASGRSAQG